MCNPAIQLAAELDRRHVHISTVHNVVLVWIEGRDPLLITPGKQQADDDGRLWTWTYHGRTGSHPRVDTAGTAETVVKFLMECPALG